MGRLTHRTGEGWTYFVTTKSWEGTFWFQVIRSAQIVVDKMLEHRDKANYLLHDFVLMPNHLHLILTPKMDPIPQGLKPIGTPRLDVGAKAPTPNITENAAKE
jgi:REP element-mobilizing transposase RayT